MAWRFFQRLNPLPGVHINVGKTGASLSVGPQGAQVTVGPRGIQATAGLPGSGLSYSKHFGFDDIGSAPSLNSERTAWRQAFIDHLLATIRNPAVTIPQVKAAIAYRETLKLSDAEMGAGLLNAVALITARAIEAEALGRSTLYEPSPEGTTQTK